ncbi:beta-microseminoprotein-like [Mercenaria mercenaria]|uniref:beta-microseminoprotein-like n=1 Tax=Mercenaria mercenaria TaxID=6596 RepID=UPI00234F99A9|nr:beta-microseminoprotein-like [Mercenaria mercenaria]
MGLTFESGASFKAPAPHCVKCKCSGGVLNCCGYGKNGGVASVAGCMQLDDHSTCDLQFVDSMDETQPCAAWVRIRSMKDE